MYMYKSNLFFRRQLRRRKKVWIKRLSSHLYISYLYFFIFKIRFSLLKYVGSWMYDKHNHVNNYIMKYLIQSNQDVNKLCK